MKFSQKLVIACLALALSVSEKAVAHTWTFYNQTDAKASLYVTALGPAAWNLDHGGVDAYGNQENYRNVIPGRSTQFAYTFGDIRAGICLGDVYVRFADEPANSPFKKATIRVVTSDQKRALMKAMKDFGLAVTNTGKIVGPGGKDLVKAVAEILAVPESAPAVIAKLAVKEAIALILDSVGKILGFAMAIDNDNRCKSRDFILIRDQATKEIIVYYFV